MSDGSWETAMAQLLTAQRAFMNGDATGLQRLYSHRDDVTVMGGFGGFERGWAEVGPRLAWAASHFHGGDYSQQDIPPAGRRLDPGADRNHAGATQCEADRRRSL
jgi:hypothetical protein